MAHLRAVREADDLLDERLSGVVGGVRLSGHDQLDGSVLVEQQCLEPVRVTQHQRQPLVGRNPAGEPDRQHIRIESRCHPVNFRLDRAALQPRSVQPAANVLNERGP